MAGFEGEAAREGAGWSEEEAPLAICAWLHLVFGHFSMAPLLAEVLGRDPLSKACLEDQTRFLVKLAGRMAVPVESSRSPLSSKAGSPARVDDR